MAYIYRQVLKRLQLQSLSLAVLPLMTLFLAQKQPQSEEKGES